MARKEPSVRNIDRRTIYRVRRRLMRHLNEGSYMYLEPTVAPFLRYFTPGTFYSPVPNLADIEVQTGRMFNRRVLPGINMRESEQESLFREVASLARDVQLATKPNTTTRYGFDNTNFGGGDALVLAGMLRQLRPGHYLEVGSGFSTALAADINDMFLGGSMTITAVEPYPDLLKSLLRPSDLIDILPQPVQSVSLDRFAALQPNDVLFIDSSHMLKPASDVQFLVTSVLPVLREGVYIHFHDIFWPFEYPRDWIEAGRAWNEDYLLHAFLLYNDVFEIVLWNDWLGKNRRDLVAQELPAMLEQIGGSLWLRRAR